MQWYQPQSIVTAQHGYLVGYCDRIVYLLPSRVDFARNPLLVEIVG